MVLGRNNVAPGAGSSQPIKWTWESTRHGPQSSTLVQPKIHRSFNSDSTETVCLSPHRLCFNHSPAQELACEYPRSTRLEYQCSDVLDPSVSCHAEFSR